MNALDISLENARKVLWLLVHDYVFLSNYNAETGDWDDAAYVLIYTSDLEHPGAAAVPLEEKDLDRFIEVVKSWPVGGTIAWCVRNNGLVIPDLLDQEDLPVGRLNETQRHEYEEALIYLDEPAE